MRELDVSRPIVLVTGAGGFIGRPAVAALAERHVTVHALTRRAEPLAGATAWAADLFDDRRVAEVMAEIRPTHLLHLAWEVTPGRFWSDSANLNWVGASLKLFRTFVESGGQRIVAAGTCAEYDWTARSALLSESDTQLRPATLYGSCKDATRRVLQHFCDDRNCSWAWARLFNLYGPGEPSSKLVSSLIQSLRAGQPALCNAGEQELDFLHVTDAADALVELLLASVTGCVNVGTGIAQNVGELARLLGDLANRPDLIVVHQKTSATSEALRVVADVRRLTSELRWRPRVVLADGLNQQLRASGL